MIRPDEALPRRPLPKIRRWWSHDTQRKRAIYLGISIYGAAHHWPWRWIHWMEIGWIAWWAFQILFRFRHADLRRSGPMPSDHPERFDGSDVSHLLAPYVPRHRPAPSRVEG